MQNPNKPLSHIFRDGIERPAHRHPNGGGWIANAANVSNKAFVGPFAEVVGGTIWGGTIWGGTIEGGTIWGGTIWGGTIWGGTIEGGTIRGGNVTKNVTFICGAVPYPVTITDDFCAVGCQWHSHDEWFAHGAEIMAKNKQSPELLAMLLQFIKMHKES